MRKKPCALALQRYLQCIINGHNESVLAIITKFAVIVFGTFFMVPAIAQDYQSILPHRNATYESDGGYMKFVKTDSTATVDESTTLFLFRNIQETAIEGCFVPYGVSWLGGKIIMNANGDNMFFNRDNDTILIMTQAAQGESWIAYADTNIQVQAEIADHDLMDVLGETDSVKTITFTVYNSELDPIEHILNDKTLRLSKNQGLVTTLNFLRFPDFSNWRESVEEYNLVGLSNPAIGVQNLSWFDVHDHQPGDELHIVESKDDGMSGIVHFDYKQIIEKFQERHDFNDSIVYRVERKIRREEKKYPDTIVVKHFINDTITRVVKDFKSFNIIPGQALFIEVGLTHFHQRRNNNQMIEKWAEPDFYFQDGIDECWHQVFLLKTEIPYGRYYSGLGGPYYEDIWGSGSRSLVYYKKGDQTWGSPLDFTSAPGISDPSLVSIYPNPATAGGFHVNILPENLPVVLEILDLNGKIVHREKLVNQDNYIHVPILHKGIYLYRILNSGTYVDVGKIILH
jgi:hypothetical protein